MSLVFKNIVDISLKNDITEFMYITNEKYSKIDILLWKNVEKIGVCVKLYSNTTDLKNYILKVGWIFNNDKFEIIPSCSDFGQSMGTELSKKIVNLFGDDLSNNNKNL